MVKKRESSWQSDFRYGGQRYRKSFGTEHEALEWEAKAKQRLKMGLPAEDSAVADGWTLKSLAEATRERYWKGTPNEQNSRINANDLCGILGDSRHPRDVSPTDIDKAIQEFRKRGLEAATINRKLATLSKMMRFAVDRGIIPKAPKIERLREAEGRLRWYTHEEEARVLKVLESDRDFADLIVFLADTGARLTEACELEWRDVDDRHVRLNKTKNGKSRGVPQTSRVRELLKRRRAGDTSPRVFPGWDRFKARNRWEDVRVLAGLTDEEAVMHAWRHTCASRLVQAAVPIQVVQQWLGHKTLAMTLRYAHLAPTNLEQAVGVLERRAAV